MTSKQKLKKIAEDTLEILKSGNFKTEIKYCKKHTYLIDDDLHKHIEESNSLNDLYKEHYDTVIHISPITTVEAIELLYDETGEPPFALNFASATNPGGGWLKGARAQEESLARVSGLYSSLTSDKCKDFYIKNRMGESKLYTDLMIYSEKVPFFKNDYGIDSELYFATILTSPAPNVQYLDEIELEDLSNVLEERIDKILAIAKYKHHENLILGAWGCGVFGNSPGLVATIFKTLLESKYTGDFKKVIFAVMDKTDIFNGVFYGITPSKTS